MIDTKKYGLPESDLNDIVNASLEIDNLLLPWKFDLIIYNRIKENALIEHIKRVGIVLFQKVKPGLPEKR